MAERGPTRPRYAPGAPRQRSGRAARPQGSRFLSSPPPLSGASPRAAELNPARRLGLAVPRRGLLLSSHPAVAAFRRHGLGPGREESRGVAAGAGRSTARRPLGCARPPPCASSACAVGEAGGGGGG